MEERISLVLPDESWESAVMEFKAEFLAHGDSMDGTSALQDMDSYGTWLQRLRDNSRPETTPPGLVPATTLLAVRASDKRLVGMIDIRHELNEYLLQFGGHIGYSVRKSERQKGYATEMLRLSLGECGALGLSRVLLCCDKENSPSAKTILTNGGVLENEVPEGDEITLRYWIEV